MINEKNAKILVYISLVFFVFALDRVSKTIILNVLDNRGNVDIFINSFFGSCFYYLFLFLIIGNA